MRIKLMRINFLSSVNATLMRIKLMRINVMRIKISSVNAPLVQKETQCFYLQFWGLKIIDFKNCFNSVVLPSNNDLDCIVSS